VLKGESPVLGRGGWQAARGSIHIEAESLGPSSRAKEGEARSHLADGRLVAWRPLLPAGTPIAVDAEIAAQPVPSALRRRFGIHDPTEFWPAWTRVEVCCKLLHVPILHWLSAYGMTSEGAGPQMTTLVLDGLVVTCGVLTQTLSD
jgi:hypothetical protein